MKKHYIKRKNQFKKKGDKSSLVCFEINLVHIPSNTWWLDSSTTIHVSNSKQGFLTNQSLSERGKYIEMVN